MRTRFSTHNTQPSQKARKSMNASLDQRKEKLKLFKRGDSVVISGGVVGIFVEGDDLANALVRVGTRTQRVNPLNLEHNKALAPQGAA